MRYDCLNLVFVRLTEFSKSIEDCLSLRDKLTFSLRNAHKLKERPEQFSDNLFGKLFSIAEISNFTPNEYSEYEASLMTRWDYSASMKFAKEEGVAIGRDEGIAIGREEGVAIGTLQTARNMKSKGFNTAVIAEITGLPEEEIEVLDIYG